MASQKSTITALDGFWSMQMFSYNCVSHHNTVKLELLQLVFPSVSYELGLLRVVWRKTCICVKKILSSRRRVVLPDPKDDKSHKRNSLHSAVSPA